MYLLIVRLYKGLHRNALAALAFRDIMSQAGDDGFIRAFGLSISSWMAGCCDEVLDSKLLLNLLEELAHKRWSVICKETSGNSKRYNQMGE